MGKALRIILLVALAALVLVGVVRCYESWRDAKVEEGKVAGRAEVQKRWDADSAQAQGATIAKQQADAKETMRRLEIQEGNQHAKDQRDALAARDAAAARAAADGLRVSATAYLHAAGCDGRSGDSAVECVRAATANALDVLGQLASEGASLAAAADDARSRGLKCEADYDALTPAVSASSSAPGAPAPSP